MKIRERVELKTTINRELFNRLYKRFLDRKAKIKCCLCRYNKGENANKRQKNWKKLRKTRYKIMDSDYQYWEYPEITWDYSFQNDEEDDPILNIPAETDHDYEDDIEEDDDVVIVPE